MTTNNLQKIHAMQLKMKISMLGLIVRDRIPNRTIRYNTGVRDAVETILRMKWNWAGHVARVADSRWIRKISQWRSRVYHTEIDAQQPDKVTIYGDSLETGCARHWTINNGKI
ncbi:uncharacterized protein LOC125504177 [Dendroctonus ponderosae]|uniref:uncharacterized protein LOC125504177 n=1 Tax=Dendroctonus ponderosae TaxID=77166 RepID=UPI0020360109|nr:uncharacterized protein LOC125504177 [Dendroctonus ponderosae]